MHQKKCLRTQGSCLGMSWHAVFPPRRFSWLVVSRLLVSNICRGCGPPTRIPLTTSNKFGFFSQPVFTFPQLHPGRCCFGTCPKYPFISIFHFSIPSARSWTPGPPELPAPPAQMISGRPIWATKKKRAEYFPWILIGILIRADEIIPTQLGSFSSPLR